eukprot:TRINITY_DN8581_c0_g1_i9.p1 TRINITY_DN8581_c0_g1~~TRINITY_DN8581_c0_g1_i9.p1  ORF type:complete len:350 (-),score=45.15 TRINITY_DN8581_c0_g1_i9:23-1072(-)
MLREQALQCLRKEAEAADRFAGIVMFHSIAGGTGSGLGSHLCEDFNDLYPAAYKLAVSVAPFSAGEIPVQYYNALLTTAALQEHVDGIVLLDNSRVMKVLSSAATARKVSGGVTMEDMNLYMTYCLSGAFLPLSRRRDEYTKDYAARTGQVAKPSKPGASKLVHVPFDVSDVITTVCPDAATKFTDAYTSMLPFVDRDDRTWEQHAKSIVEHAGTRDLRRRPVQSALSMITVRGAGFSDERDRVMKITSRAYAAVKWNSSGTSWRFSDNGLLSHGLNRCISAVGNRSNICSLLHRIALRSRSMFDARAYVHHYERFGCGKENFLAAFETLRTVVDSYNEWFGFDEMVCL